MTEREKPGHDRVRTATTYNGAITGLGDEPLLRADVPVIHVLTLSPPERRGHRKKDVVTDP
jgi:hypothetical protein